MRALFEKDTFEDFIDPEVKPEVTAVAFFTSQVPINTTDREVLATHIFRAGVARSHIDGERKIKARSGASENVPLGFFVAEVAAF